MHAQMQIMSRAVSMNDGAHQHWKFQRHWRTLNNIKMYSKLLKGTEMHWKHQKWSISYTFNAFRYLSIRFNACQRQTFVHSWRSRNKWANEIAFPHSYKRVDSWCSQLHMNCLEVNLNLENGWSYRKHVSFARLSVYVFVKKDLRNEVGYFFGRVGYWV